MTDYISRKAAIKEFETSGSIFVYGVKQCEAIISRLEAIPAADVVPMDFHERCLQIEIQKRMALKRERGKWKDGLSVYGTYSYKICPFCECVYIRKSNFCPHCGADMREEQT